MQIIGRDHYLERDGVKIYLWEKFCENNQLDKSSNGIVLLVHGATWSGRPIFDLNIRDYSLMNYLARNNFHCWSIDIHGYGRSGTTEQDWSEPESAAADIGAAIDYILTQHQQRRSNPNKISLLTWSWGAQVSGIYAMAQPEKIDKFILYAPLWQGTPELREIPIPAEQYRVNSDTAAREDFVIGQYEQDVIELFASEALKECPRSPNGIFRGLRSLPILDPTRLTMPLMIIHGAQDRYSRPFDLLALFQQAAATNKAYRVLPHGGHIIHLEKEHYRFKQAVLNFLLEKYY